MRKRYLVIGLFFLLVISSIGPLTFGYKISEQDNMINNYSRNRYLYTDYFNCYTATERQNLIKTYAVEKSTSCNNIETTAESNPLLQSQTLDGLMVSPWPTYCHDVRHTGRSPYSTIDTWDETWKFETRGTAWGGPAIDKDGTIYIAAYPLQAVYPNGTLKWTFDTYGYFESVTPAIDENGTIYIGDRGDDDYFYAVNPNGTMKWRHPIGATFSSPIIANDGSIIFTDTDNWFIKSIYPNGTLKWTFKTDFLIYSSPAIGLDGTVYCGCHDTCLYALYPNNGTLKWKYKTGDWIRTSPCVADDGTIYVVSLDNYLHAVYPNGTRRWTTYVGAGTSPTIGQDGTIYAGYSTLYALNPSDGSVKWTFPVGGAIRGGTPCNSIDGTIYLGTNIGSEDGEIIAIYPDGTLKFRKRIMTVESAPAIGADGTVYIGSDAENSKGYLHAFGIGPLKADANGPYYGLINTPLEFTGSSSGGYYPFSYLWDFGDNQTSEEQNPTHTYTTSGNYTVILSVTDNTSNTSSDKTWAWIQETNTEPNKPTIEGITDGNVKTSYSYNVSTSDPDDNIIWYYIDWGDNTNNGWIGPYESGTEITQSHSWAKKGTYIIKVKAKDPYNAESPETTLEVTMPRARTSYNHLFMRFLEHLHFLKNLKFKS